MMKDAQNLKIKNQDIDGEPIWLPIWVHRSLVLWIVFNILFNYLFCVTSRKDRPGSKNGYEIVVRQLALVTGFQYPESEEEKEAWIVEWRRRRLHRSENPSPIMDSDMNERSARDDIQPTKRASLPIVTGDDFEASTIPRSQYNLVPADDVFNGTATVQTATTIRNVRPLKRPKPSWMDLNPYEWSYCYHSNLIKAPRAHYDHVTQCLILNMDHYCPWMFNASKFHYIHGT